MNELKYKVGDIVQLNANFDCAPVSGPVRINEIDLEDNESGLPYRIDVDCEHYWISISEISCLVRRSANTSDITWDE